MSYSKYYVYKEQISTDGGASWQYTGNETPSGESIGTYSTLEECEGIGPTPPTPPGIKWEALCYSEMKGGIFVQTITNECNSSSATTKEEIPWHIQVPDCFVQYVSFGDCVKIIGFGTFSDRADGSGNEITGVTLGNNVEIISGGGFYNCSELEEIYLPDSVTTIADGKGGQCDCIGAFEDCKSLKNVRFGKNIIYIGSFAFDDCTSLTNVTIEATTPPTLSNYAFKYTNNTFRIYVPAESVNAYKTASVWSQYASRIYPIP